MKPKLFIAIAVILLCNSSTAQLNLGYSVVTMSGQSLTDPVVKIFDISNPLSSSAPLGDNWNQTPIRSWSRDTLGQVFGIAINNNNGQPIVYVSNTQVYKRSGISSPSWYVEYENPPIGSYADGVATLIWKLDPANGVATSLVQSTQVNSVGGTYIFNRGTGIGNICYDTDHNQLFATNMEDGRIYRIQASSGTILSRLTPNFDTLCASAIGGGFLPVFPPLGCRTWGIGYKNGKLYFSRWNSDIGHQNGAHNEIYSIGIDGMGEFVSTPYGGGEYVGGEQVEISNIPFLLSSVNNPPPPDFSNPVSDIEFSADGTVMFLAERTMKEAFNDGLPSENATTPNQYLNYAHGGRVLRYNYNLISNSWILSLDNYWVGNHQQNTNSTGGVDLGYLAVDSLLSDSSQLCEQLVWSNGDALENCGYAYWGGSNSCEYIVGLAGIPIGGNMVADNPPTNPYAVNSSSYYSDIFGSVGDKKARPGDVDIYRLPCVSQVTSCDTIQATLTDSIATTLCYGATVIVSGGGGSYGQVILTNDADTIIRDIMPTQEGESHDTIQISYNPGTYQLCYVAYTSHPDSVGSTCSSIICSDITIQVCGCDSVVNASLTLADTTLALPDTVCLGEVMVIRMGGGLFGRMIVDGNVSEVISTADGYLYDTVTVWGSWGEKDICYIAYSANPDSTNIFCSDTVCYSIIVEKCNCDSIHAFFSIQDTIGAEIHTVCLGDSVIFRFGGGVYGQLIISNGDTVAVEEVYETINGSYTRMVEVSDISPGFYQFCYVAYSAHPDSTDAFCSDTLCYDITIESCACDTLPNAFFEVVGVDSVPSVLCLGSTIVLRHGGGPYGELLSEDDDGGSDVMEVPSVDNQYIRYDTISIEGDGGFQHVCYVSYSANPDSTNVFCSDTVCYDIEIKLCRCDSIQPELASHIAGTSYAFSLNSEPEPNTIKWSVDGGSIQLLTGSESYYYPIPTSGTHTVCALAQYVRPRGDGTAECCYVTVCDTLDDSNNCDLWRATDSISYNYPSYDPRYVSFNYHGVTTDSMTIVWDFGDGTQTASEGGASHYYSYEDTFTVCAFITWTKPGHINCCCVDSICFAVDATACGLAQINLLDYPVSYSSESGYKFQMSYNYSGYCYTGGYPINFTGIDWSPMDDDSSSSIISPWYMPPTDGNWLVCFDAQYEICTPYNTKECVVTECKTFHLEGNEPQNLMRFFPNPASEDIIIEIYNYSKAKSAKISVADMMGREFFTKEFTDIRDGANPIYLNISSFPKGLYSVTLKMESIQQVGKLIRE